MRGNRLLMGCFCLQWIVNRDQDSIYEILKSKLSDGFASYDLPSTERLNFYEHQNAIVTGTPNSITYGPHVPGYPKSVRFAALKWTDAPEAVLPSYTAVLECTKAPDSFDPITRQYTARPAFKGCYPLTMTANVIFHHAFASSEVQCMHASVACLLFLLLRLATETLTLCWLLLFKRNIASWMRHRATRARAQ